MRNYNQVGHYDDSKGASLTIQQLQRFWCSFERRTPEECWPWTKTIRKREGVNKNILYGSFSISGRNYLAHRIAYQLTYGPTDLCVLHKCDFGLCVNTEHLFAGTRADNNRDMSTKGRHVRWNNRLTNEQAAYIRSLEGYTQQSIAEAFGVSPSTVQHIMDGRTYRNTHRGQHGIDIRFSSQDN